MQGKDSGFLAKAPPGISLEVTHFDWIPSCILFDYKRVIPPSLIMHFEDNPHWLNLSQLDTKQGPLALGPCPPVKWIAEFKSKSPQSVKYLNSC